MIFYIELQSAGTRSLPCAQGRVGVGLHGLAAMSAIPSPSFRRKPDGARSAENIRRMAPKG